MKTPDPGNLYLGAGSVLFDRFDASGNSSGALRHLGNVDTFTSNTTVTTVQKKSSMSGARGILAEAVTETLIEVSIGMSEYAAENLALALLGEASPLLQTAEATVTARSVAAAPLADVWYELTSSAGDGVFNPTVTTIKQATTTLVEGTDYILRADVGMVMFKAGGAFVPLTTPAEWDGTIPAVADTDGKAVVEALAVGAIRGHLVYISAQDQSNGPLVRVDVWIASVKPDGDLPFIGASDFGAFNLKATVQLDATKKMGEQYLRVSYL